VTIKKGLVTASAVALAAFVMAATQVEAGPLEHDHYSDVNVEVIEDYCDLPGFPDLTVLREQRFDGQILVQSRGPDGLVYAADHLRFVTVRTNLANGKTLTTEGHYNTTDQKVIDNGDGTLTIRSAITGSDHSYDTAGSFVHRIAGQGVFEALFDHHGTPTDRSDDEFLEFLGFTKLVGHDSDSRDFCQIVHEHLA
jgi:hypothetical protein